MPRWTRVPGVTALVRAKSYFALTDSGAAFAEELFLTIIHPKETRAFQAEWYHVRFGAAHP